jgi:hypothetical protein
MQNRQRQHADEYERDRREEKIGCLGGEAGRSVARWHISPSCSARFGYGADFLVVACERRGLGNGTVLSFKNSLE